MLGARLRQLRLARGLSLEKLANLSQLSKQALSRAENDNLVLSEESQKRVAAILKVEVSDLSKPQKITVEILW